MTPTPLSIPPIDPKQGPAATPISFIRAMVLAYRRYGLDPSNALGLAQIAPDDLDDPAGCVTANQMEIMSAVTMQELDDEALGWFSRRLPWGSYGMLCRASLSAPNLDVALKRWCRHHRLLTDDLILELATEEGVATLRLHPRRVLGDFAELCLVTSLRYVIGYACWLIDSRIPILRATFPYPAPLHQDAYPLMFRGPVLFAATAASFSFDAQYLGLPLRRAEPELQQMLQRALPLTVLQYRRDRLLVQKIRRLLRTRTGQPCTAETLAALLHVSVRTLHRQLTEEGASLQDLKNETRRERAIELLSKSQRPIKQIAQASGFANEKSFARAFREWTGQSPSQYRLLAAVQTHPTVAADAALAAR
jgi:AraC-like DNA-binding protein